MAKTELATLGGGCFWCLEAVYRRVKGVRTVTSGYAGGDVSHPTYEEVSSGLTGHAEVVQIEFDSRLINYQQLLDIFWASHDPTTADRQGADVGSQYRSIILYHDQSQKAQAQTSLVSAQKLWPQPIVTQLTELKEFYPAEAYHQDYFAKHPETAYCQLVINPKLVKLRQDFPKYLSPSK